MTQDTLRTISEYVYAGTIKIYGDLNFKIGCVYHRLVFEKVEDAVEDEVRATIALGRRAVTADVFVEINIENDLPPERYIGVS